MTLLSPVGPTPPLVPILIIPTAISHNAATIQWRVAALSYDPEEYRVLYGTSEMDLFLQSDGVPSGDVITRTAFDLSVELQGLSPTTRYHYRVQASNSARSTGSNIQTFTTTEPREFV